MFRFLIFSFRAELAQNSSTVEAAESPAAPPWEPAAAAAGGGDANHPCLLVTERAQRLAETVFPLHILNRF